MSVSFNIDLSPTVHIGAMHPDLKLTRNTWIISDTHFGHTNIIKYCKRPFNHNMMMRAWEDMIRPDEYVLHLGDVSIWHSKHAYWASVTRALPGKKFLILGNHDGQWNDKQWRSIAGFTVTPPFIHDRILFTHEPAAPSGQWDTNIHGHTHNHSPFRRYEKLQATYYNVSIEGMDYKPVRLGEILDELRS